MSKRYVVIIARMAALVALFVTTALTEPHGLTQAATAQASAASSDKLSFEIASIKANHAPDAHDLIRLEPGRLVATGATAKTLIQLAYNAQDFQVSGGPGWISANRYDLDAKEEESVAKELQTLSAFQQMDRIRLMLQALLVDRFKLTVVHQTKEVPVYVLTVAKGGQKLSQSVPAALEPADSTSRGQAPKGPRLGLTGRGQITGTGVPVSLLAQMLSHQLGRQVVDKTELSGNYDFTLQWMPDESQPQSPGAFEGDSARSSANAPAPDVSASLFTAIQEQLGLKLEPQRGPIDVLVIDHIEEPSPN